MDDSAKPHMDDSAKPYSPEGAELGDKLDRSSINHLGIDRSLEDCDEDGHVKRTGLPRAGPCLLTCTPAGRFSLATAILAWQLQHYPGRLTGLRGRRH